MIYKQLIESQSQQGNVQKLRNSKAELKSQESQSKSANRLAVGKLKDAVKLESEKLRLRGQAQEKIEKLQKKGE